MIPRKFMLGAAALSMTAMPVTSVCAAEEKPTDIPVLNEQQREDADVKETGSISIKLEHSKDAESMKGVKFGITKVADLDKGEYVILDTYKNVNVPINKLETAEDLENATSKFNNLVKTPEKTITTDEKGQASVSDLDVGVYLINVIDDAKYDKIKPTMISIPTYIEKEGYKFDIEITPKHSPKDKLNTGVYNESMGQYAMLLGAAMAAVSLGVMKAKKDCKQ